MALHDWHFVNRNGRLSTFCLLKRSVIRKLTATLVTSISYATLTIEYFLNAFSALILICWCLYSVQRMCRCSPNVYIHILEWMIMNIYTCIAWCLTLHRTDVYRCVYESVAAYWHLFHYSILQTLDYINNIKLIFISLIIALHFNICIYHWMR